MRSVSMAMKSGHAGAAYATRSDAQPGKLDLLMDSILSPLRMNRISWRQLSGIIKEITRHAADFESLSDASLKAHGVELQYRLKATSMSRDVVAETFALVREIAGRQVGMKHFDEQLAGGWTILNGMIAEMETGEGKTLTATLPACTAALAGIPVHVITVNDYLAARDAESMRPVYEALGLTVGAALADMSEADRRLSYGCDVTYTTNKQVAFDHLRDRIQLKNQNSQLGLHFSDERRSALLLRGLHFAVIDEADSVLVDEAVTPLIISRQGNAVYTQETLNLALDVAGSLDASVHFRLDAGERKLTLLEGGKTYLKSWSEEQNGLWKNTRYREHIIIQALRALHLFQADRHYLVEDGKVKIIDEFTGRLMEDRSWEQGLHQLIEVKENCKITGEMETIGRISYQRFFRRYLMLGGMSGTVHEVSHELRRVYDLEVMRIPTHKKNQRTYSTPRFFITEKDKWQYLIQRIKKIHETGRPILIGTRSVAASEHLSQLLSDHALTHSVLNAKQDKHEADVIGKAGILGQITVATNMAGRGTDIKLSEEVVKLGGLHVILTERHEARRIDRQLFGRCARQGDPGSCEEVASIDDELFSIHMSHWLRTMAMYILSSGVAGVEFLVRILVYSTQKNAQSKSSRMRVQMQKMDEYLSNVLAFTGRLE